MAAKKEDEREPGATRPFRRLYFDSDVLIGAGWPGGSAELQTLAVLARDVGVELFLPEPVAQELDVRLPKEADVLADYQRAVNDLQGKLTMARSPATSRPTAVFFDLAVRHYPPFREEGRGFQDAVILFSVIDHLHATAGVVAGLVTRDGTLRQGAQRLAEREGVAIEVFEDMKSVVGQLTAHCDGARALGGGLPESRNRAARGDAADPGVHYEQP